VPSRLGLQSVISPARAEESFARCAFPLRISPGSVFAALPGEGKSTIREILVKRRPPKPLPKLALGHPIL